MVYVGTANSFNPGTIAKPGDEDSPYKGRCYNLDYIESKYFAQMEVMTAVREKGLPAVIVNPTFMLGPFDSKPGTGAIILAVAQGSREPASVIVLEHAPPGTEPDAPLVFVGKGITFDAGGLNLKPGAGCNGFRSDYG